MDGELQDWELLHDSDESGSVNSSESVENMRGLEGIEGDSEGMIRTDYFSLDSHNKYVKAIDESEMGSVESDNPSWIDPDSETRFPRKESGEFWPDSGSDRSDERKNELGFVQNDKSEVGFQGIGEIGSEGFEKLWPVSMEFGGFQNETEMGICGNNENSGEGLEFSAGENCGEGSAVAAVAGDGNASGAIGEVKSGGGEREKRSVVWWKVPFEFLKYCGFRVSPFWTFSVAAAIMGFVILGHRLYKMKRKSQSLQLKVTMDDKKVSQFMTRAARLNEAFSLVKRVPVVRPSLPAAGLTPWPVMSLR